MYHYHHHHNHYHSPLLTVIYLSLLSIIITTTISHLSINTTYHHHHHHYYQLSIYHYYLSSSPLPISHGFNQQYFVLFSVQPHVDVATKYVWCVVQMMNAKHYAKKIVFPERSRWHDKHAKRFQNVIRPCSWLPKWLTKDLSSGSLETGER
jgi:hypothetical protein